MTLDSNFDAKKLPLVSIVKILPKISQQALFAYKRCYIGISLENPVFEGNTLRALLFWSLQRFDETLVIIGDYLCRYNEKMLSGCDSKKASQKAQSLGDSFLLQTKELFGTLPHKKIHLTRWKEHLQSKEYKESEIILKKLFESDSDFRASVERDAFDFIQRQKKKNQKPLVDIEEAIELCCQYLLEEIGVFSALSQQGWHVELYPGSELHVLVEVAKGKYTAVPKGLQERISVELKISSESPH